MHTLPFDVFFRGGSHNENHGLGVERPSDLRQNDDEFDAYRKRMMLAYRFRPNPLVSKFIFIFLNNKKKTLIYNAFYKIWYNLFNFNNNIDFNVSE